MKRIGALALAAALAGTLATGALAQEPELVISPNPNAYGTTLVVNGQTLDTAGLPAPDGTDLLPLRLVAEADHGSASWFEDENLGQFLLDGNVIQVSFADNSITVNDKPVEASAQVRRGVTFVPADVVDALEGYTVQTNEALDVDRLDITTPNNAPLVKLAYRIIDETGMARGMKNSPEEIQEYLNIDTANFDEIVAFTPMMINSDTVIIGKLAEGADKDKAKADLKARQDVLIASFEQYLPGPLELAKNGKIVESNGYLMLIVSPDTDKAIELFEAGVKDL